MDRYGAKSVRKIIEKDGTELCAISREGFIPKEVWINKATYKEIAKIMNWYKEG